MSGFPYGTSARYEDKASTTPLNFSVTWENRNWLGGVLSLFFRAKLSCIFFTFILISSIMAVKLRKSVRSASWPLSQDHSVPYNGKTLASFSQGPGIPRFFPNWAPLPSTFPLGGQFSRHLSASPPTQYLLPGWKFLSIFQLSPTQCLDHEWVCPRCFTWKQPPPPPVSFLLGGGR